MSDWEFPVLVLLNMVCGLRNLHEVLLVSMDDTYIFHLFIGHINLHRLKSSEDAWFGRKYKLCNH